MSRTEQKRVQCTVASTRAAKRSFEQLFRTSYGPPCHFESVIHGGVCKWVVLFREHLCIVPFNAADEKKCTRIQTSDIRSLQLDRNDNFLFADEEVTLRSAKVHINYEEQHVVRARRASTSPVRRILAGRRGSASAHMEEASSIQETSVLSEGFHLFDERTRLWLYLHQMWIGNLSVQLYGWTKNDEIPDSRVKEVYVDMQKEMGVAKGIQNKVDLLDELAHAVRFNVCLKRCVLLQSPSLIQWITAELRKFAVDKWRSQPEMQGLGRPEVLQYLTVLLETLHKTLFQCWPVFVGPEGEDDLDKLLEPRTGVLIQLIQALWLPLVLSEELQSKDPQPALNVMHALMSVMYEISLLFSHVEARTHQEGGQLSRQQQLRSHICAATTEKAMERRVENLVIALQSVLLSMPSGPYKIVIAFHYASVLNSLCCQSASQLSKVVGANHTEDLRFVLPGFVSSHAEDASHPLEKKTVSLLQGLLHFFCPDQARRSSSEGAGIAFETKH